MKLFRLTKLVLLLFFGMGITELHAQDILPPSWYDPCTWGDYEITGATTVIGESNPVYITTGNMKQLLYQYDIDEKDGSWMTCASATWTVEGGEIYTTDRRNGDPILQDHNFQNVDISINARDQYSNRTISVRWFASDKPIVRRVICTVSSGCPFSLPCLKTRTIEVTVNPDGKGGYYENSFLESNPFKSYDISKYSSDYQKYTKGYSNCIGNDINKTFAVQRFPEFTSWEYGVWTISDGYEFSYLKNGKHWTSGSTNFMVFTPWWDELIEIRKKDPFNTDPKDCIVKLSIYNTTTNNLIYEYPPFVLKADPCELTNTDIFIDDSGIPQKEITKLIDHLDNVKIIGNYPISGNIGPNGYAYKWYISYNNEPFQLIPNANGIDYTLPFTNSEKTVIKRVTSTPTYTKENIVTINLQTCTQPNWINREVAVICDNQVIYNCISGNTYQFKTILGPTWNPGNRPFKFIWKTSSTGGDPWYDDGRVGERNTYNFKNYIFRFTKDWSPKQTIYVKREVEEYYKPDIWSTNEWRNIQNSNVITLTMYTFEEPQKQLVKITGDELLKCGQSSGIYQLSDKLGNIITDPTKFGIANIEWFIPSNWQGWSLKGAWATSIQPNYFKNYNPNTNIPQGGQVYAKLTYFDGNIITTNVLNVKPRVSISATVSATATGTLTSVTSNPLEITMCAQETATLETYVTSNTPYSVDWKIENSSSVLSTYELFDLSGANLASLNYVNLTISAPDVNNTTCKVIYPRAVTIVVNNPGQGWASHNFYNIDGVNMAAKTTSNIVVDKQYLPYYIGKEGGVYQWQFVGNGWKNVLLSSEPKKQDDGEIGIFEVDANNMAIYYTSSNSLGKKVLKRLQKVGGLWSQEVAFTLAGTNENDNITLRVHPTNGNVYYRHGNIIYILKATGGYVTSSSVRSIATTNSYPNSKFAVAKDKMYYINTDKEFKVANIDGVVETVNTFFSKTASPTTDVQVDDLSNGYYTAEDNQIYKYTNALFNTTNDTPLGAIFPCENTVCNGTFGVNATTGNLYVADNSNNIIQYHPKAHILAGWEPLNISHIEDANGPAISTNENYKQFSTVVFSKNNVFYMSGEGLKELNTGSKIKLINYNTSLTCQPAYLRTDNTLLTDGDYLENIHFTNNLDSLNTIAVHPNPLTESSVINYSLLQNDGLVQITLLNAQGVVVKELVNEYQKTGNYSITLNATDLNAGLYFLQYSSAAMNKIVKVIVK